VLARTITAIVTAVCLAAIGGFTVESVKAGDLASFDSQLCALPPEWLQTIQRGYQQGHSAQISFLPDTPIYFAGGGDGWSHSGPWPYLQQVPLVFYGPGVVDKLGMVNDPGHTLADVAPTLAALLRGSLSTADGSVLDEVSRLERSVRQPRPRLIFTMVWDGGGWNTLRAHPDAWPNLARIMDEGITYNADVGSSPSVTPAIHATLGTGVFPATHGITDVPLLDDTGRAVDPYLDGASGRFLEVPTLAERWDEQTGNEALIGMVGHVPWHLGMIGVGAERPGGDKDDAAWLDLDTNEWITNPDHYSLPASFGDQADLEDRIAVVDDGTGHWMGIPLDDPARYEELPAFAGHHTEELLGLMDARGYGRDAVSDLMFTNYKQIDLLGHYFNMASPQVEAAITATDDALGQIISYLDDNVGRGRYVFVMTADHGLQPTAEAVDAYGIDSNEMRRDLEDRFGPVVQDIAPTEVFLDEAALEAAGSTVEEVARFVGDYRLGDNATGVATQMLGAGSYDPYDRVMAIAVPSHLLSEVSC
jgi:arylsulfatase A-like enzyme